MYKLNIKEEFKNLIPPLSQEELSGLEQSILVEGCRDPIVTWNGYIIDGHNRYRICEMFNVEFKTVERTDLADENDVKLWMINNQLGKRNLTNIQKAELAIQIEKIEQVKAKERQLANLKQYSDKQETLETVQSTDTPNLVERTRSSESLVKAAKSVGIGYETVRKTKHILEKAPEEVIDKVRKGDVSIDRAFSQIQRTERLEKNKSTQWPKGKYRIIYADPPWKYGDERAGGNHGGAIDHYPTMSLQELIDLPVIELTEDDAVLFMWTTSPLLEDSFKLLNSWGFKYKTQFIWDKVKHNMGHYNSVRHELLLIATKGSCTPDNVQLFDSVQTIERTDKHSEKPEEFRNIIDTLYTYGNKIELFARKSVDGWEAFGNEL